RRTSASRRPVGAAATRVPSSAFDLPDARLRLARETGPRRPRAAVERRHRELAALGAVARAACAGHELVAHAGRLVRPHDRLAGLADLERVSEAAAIPLVELAADPVADDGARDRADHRADDGILGRDARAEIAADRA